MLKLAQLIAVLSAIAFMLSVAAIAYLSSPPPTQPREQQSTAQAETKDQGEEHHSFRGLVRFMFPDAISVFTFWLVLATILLAVVAVVQIGFLDRAERISAESAKAATESANITREVMDRQHRARLTVHQINLPLKTGQPLVGRLVILNGGATEARITRGTAQVYWGKNLPVIFPPDAEKVRPSPLIVEHIPAGGHYWWEINQASPVLRILSESDLPQIMQGELRLWLIGLIEYTDVTKTTHFMLFCRVYNPASGRFEPTNDPDYEYAN